MGDLSFFEGYTRLKVVTTEREITSQLIDKIKMRDAKTIRSIYQEIYPMVERYILQNSGSSSDAQDVFQDTLYIFIRKIDHPDFKLTAKLSTYIFGISKNLWLKVLTRKKLHTKTLDKEDITDLEKDNDSENLFQTKKLHERLINMGEPCHTILQQYYFFKRTMKEIALLLHYTNANNAKNQKYKCLMRLRKMMLQKK